MNSFPESRNIVYVPITPRTAMPRRFLSLGELKKDLGLCGAEDDAELQKYLNHAQEAIMKERRACILLRRMRVCSPKGRDSAAIRKKMAYSMCNLRSGFSRKQ